LSPIASRAPSPLADQNADPLIDDVSFSLDNFHFDAMPDPGPSSTPTRLASLTPEMLAAIAAFASALAQQQNQAAPPSPPPVVPPFTGSGAMTEFGGKSLPALFPSIESKIILDIISHAFAPLDLPRLLSSLAARQEYVAPPSSAPSTEHTLALKHFPSFHALLRPLLRYFKVLGAFAASSGKPWEVFAITRSLSDYVSHLTELHQQYKWSAVVIYHIEFHTIRLWDMKAGDYLGWARPDHGLLSRIVYMHLLPPPSSSTQSTTKGPSSKAKKTSSLPGGAAGLLRLEQRDLQVLAVPIEVSAFLPDVRGGPPELCLSQEGLGLRQSEPSSSRHAVRLARSGQQSPVSHPFPAPVSAICFPTPAPLPFPPSAAAVVGQNGWMVARRPEILR
jgi:hypothetical protein